MSIWHKVYSTDELNNLSRDSMVEHLDIRFEEIGPDYLKASMPVDRRTIQPLKMLHGGASVVLAETLGSVAATMCVQPDTYFCAGVEINANHIRPVREGRVTGITRPIHIGRSTHVWEIKIYDKRDQLVCISRMTLAVKPVK